MRFATICFTGQDGRCVEIPRATRECNIMRNSNMIVALVARGLALATTNLKAQGTEQASPAKSQPGQYSKEAGRAQMLSAPLNFKASNIIGLPVCNDSGEHLGKVQELIVNLGSQSVPFAIVEYGGTLRLGEIRVAVPLTDLKWSGEPRELILTATKEQFAAASSAPTSGWMAVAGQDWLKNVDRFYGQPSGISQSRFERQETSGMNEGREPIRSPSDPKGASSMENQNSVTDPQAVTTVIKPADDQLAAQVNALVQQNVQNGSRDIEVVIKNGVVTLRGRIPTEEQKELLEKQIKALPGVDRVQDSMITGTE